MRAYLDIDETILKTFSIEAFAQTQDLFYDGDVAQIWPLCQEVYTWQQDFMNHQEAILEGFTVGAAPLCTPSADIGGM